MFQENKEVTKILKKGQEFENIYLLMNSILLIQINRLQYTLLLNILDKKTYDEYRQTTQEEIKKKLKQLFSLKTLIDSAVYIFKYKS